MSTTRTRLSADERRQAVLDSACRVFFASRYRGATTADIAREAGIAGGTAPCVLNAADEVAVEAFLAGRIEFTRIPDVIGRTLEAVPGGPVRHSGGADRPLRLACAFV